MIGLTSSKPLLAPLQTGDTFLFERQSGNYSINWLQISGQIGAIAGGGSIGSAVQFAVGSYTFESGQNDSTFISFGGNFPRVPTVVGNLTNNSGEPILAFHLSGIVSSGFYVNLTDTVTGNYYNFNYMATTGSGFINLGGTTAPATLDVVNVTDDYSIQSNQTKTVFTNQFSRKQGLQLTLPMASTGLSYQFIIHSISGMSIVPTSTNKIFIANNSTTVNGFIISSGIGSAINLVAINSGEWFTQSFVGGWGIN